MEKNYLIQQAVKSLKLYQSTNDIEHYQDYEYIHKLLKVEIAKESLIKKIGNQMLENKKSLKIDILSEKRKTYLRRL